MAAPFSTRGSFQPTPPAQPLQQGPLVPRPPSQPPPLNQQSPPYSLRLPQQQNTLTGFAASAAAPHNAAAAAVGATAAAAAAPSAAASFFSLSNSSFGADPTAHARFFYKLVARVGPNRYVSIYDGQTEYVLGRTVRCDIKPLRQADAGTQSGASTARSAGGRSYTSQLSSWSGWAGDETRGGLFVCRTPEDALAARLPEESALAVAPRALLKCLCWGDSREYGSSTLAYSFLRPVQVYPLSLGYRCAWVAPRTLTCVSLSETRKRLPAFHGPAHRVLPAYRRRAEMEELGRTIREMDDKINQATRARLGW